MSGFHLFDTTNSIDHELSAGKTVLGRGADADIRLMSSSVSRKHAMVEVTDDTLTFSDLGSSNGSFVNDQPVKTTVHLHPGDTLLLGDFRFEVTHAGASGGVETPADDDATQLAAPGAGDSAEIPSVWSESVGLESASGTQFFAEADTSEAVDSYRAGRLDLPPLGSVPRLVALTGDRAGTVMELKADDNKGATWKLGRDAASVDLVIPDASVSGQHAQIVNEGARWKVVNWMSTNGTFVNGHKGLSTYLSHGDVIRIGSAELAFELPSGGGASAGGNSGGLMDFLRRLFGRG